MKLLIDKCCAKEKKKKHERLVKKRKEKQWKVIEGEEALKSAELEHRFIKADIKAI